MRISLDGLDRARRDLERMGRDFPTVLAQGLNRTAERVAREEAAEIRQVFDRPTPFTEKAINVSVARPNKRPLNAIIYLQPIQAKYLGIQIEGGERTDIMAPAAGRLNKYGNIPGKRAGLEAIAAKGKNRFIAEIKGVYGVWQRYGPKGRKVKPIVIVSKSQGYRKLYAFEDVANKTIKRTIQSDMLDAIDNAMQRL